MARKGQAAVEFLMTYGWAILAAVIAIGVLAYFGVFSPGKYVTGSAIVNAPFYVNAWNVQQDYDANTAGDQAGVVMELRNNGGEDYEVYSVGVSNCGTYTSANANGDIATAGSVTSFTVPCASALAAGNTFKGDITISYQKLNSNVDLTSTGTIAEKVTL